MVSVTSVSSLKIAIAVAERQVQRDQSQVQQDSARLSQSQNQLERDTRELNAVQERGQRAAQSEARTVQPAFERAIVSKAIKAPTVPAGTAVATTASLAPPPPLVNTEGQTIGKLINTTA